MRLGGFFISISPKRRRNNFYRLVFVDQESRRENFRLMFCGLVGGDGVVSDASSANHSQKWSAVVHHGVRQFVRQRHSGANFPADRLIMNTALHSNRDDTLRILGFTVGPS